MSSISPTFAVVDFERPSSREDAIDRVNTLSRSVKETFAGTDQTVTLEEHNRQVDELKQAISSVPNNERGFDTVPRLAIEMNLLGTITWKRCGKYFS